MAGPGADIHNVPSCQRGSDSSEYQWPLSDMEATEVEGKTMQWVGDSDNTPVLSTRWKRSRRQGGNQSPSQGRAVGCIVGEENRTSDALKVTGKHKAPLLHLETKHRN